MSAGVPRTSTLSLCAQLEEAGLVTLDEARRWRASGSTESLRAGVRDLAVRLETKRREDARRLGSVEAYAKTEQCRSVFIRRWFGEEDPPRCGRCDRCRAAQALGRTVASAVNKARAEASEEPADRRPRRRRPRKVAPKK